MPGESALTRTVIQSLLTALDEIEGGAGSGTLTWPGGRLAVTNLAKPFWPGGVPGKGRRTSRASSGPGRPLTKGDLLRHYVRAAPFILPVLADRPLVMKRFPNGITGAPFYQHRAPDKVPAGVRMEPVETSTETRPHLIGGSLATLLYTAQLGAISQDPWFSRVQAPETIDHIAIDLDPPDDAPYRRVLDVALWVRDALTTLKTIGFAKTSGAGGLHVYVPMRPGTSYASGFLFAQIVATLVAERHPKQATIERSIKARGNRIYVDYMQNALGKTLASAYSARASEFAGVSTPITWEEVEEGVSPRDFTVANFDQRIRSAGDVWKPLATAKGPDLKGVLTTTKAPRRSRATPS
jgi:bifunctional non-homologous end joining protein LigD